MVDRPRNDRKPKSKFLGMVVTPESEDSDGNSGTDSGDDGHTRITNSDHFVTVGGNEDEHAKITEISLRVEESLKKDQKQPHEISIDEFADRLGDAIDKTG